MKMIVLQCLSFLYIMIIFPINAYSDDNPAFLNFSDEGLRDVKSPVDFPANYLVLILIFVIIVACTIIAVIKFVKNNKKLEKEEVDPRMPWDIANEQFDELKKKNLLEQGLFKSYYSELSGIIRQYFENQFKINAPEMTTEEFLWSLEDTHELSVSQRLTLKKFLTSCDIVKFAKYIPHVEEGGESFLLARQLVEETKIISDKSETSINE